MSDEVYSGSYPFGNDEFEAYRGLVAWRELTQTLLGARDAIRLECLIGEICTMTAGYDCYDCAQVYILLGGPRTGKSVLLNLIEKVITYEFGGCARNGDMLNVYKWYIFETNSGNFKKNVFPRVSGEIGKTQVFDMTGETFIQSDLDAMVEAIEQNLTLISDYCCTMYGFLKEDN